MITPIQFQFDTNEVRALLDDNGEPWFVAADVCAALTVGNSRDAVSRLDEDEKGVGTVDTLGGRQEVMIVNESGLYSLILTSRKPAAKRFKKWVTSEVLPSIRKVGRYEAKAMPEHASVVPASQEFLALITVARAMGLDQNAASISANQSTLQLTGVNFMHLLGTTHLTAADQQHLYFTPTQLGKRLGVSARQLNLLLAEAGLQVKEGDIWSPTEAAEGLYRLLDTSKRNSTGTMITQMKWSDAVLRLVNVEEDAA